MASIYTYYKPHINALRPLLDTAQSSLEFGALRPLFDTAQSILEFGVKLRLKPLFSLNNMSSFYFSTVIRLQTKF